MKNIIYDFALRMFLSKDELRVALHEPCQQESFVFATNAHVLIKVPSEKCIYDYSNNDNFPKNVKGIIDEVNPNSYSIINRNDLLENLIRCEFDYERQTCEECDGFGVKECKCCRNEADCSDCDGFGTVPSSKPFRKLELSGDRVLFHDKLIDPAFLYIVFNTALLLNQEEIKVEHNSENDSKILFKLDDVEILVMCCKKAA